MIGAVMAVDHAPQSPEKPVTVRRPWGRMVPMASGIIRWNIGSVKAIEKLRKSGWTIDEIVSIMDSFPIR